MTTVHEATAGRIADAGDSALVLELEALIDPGVNARAIGCAQALRAAALPGVRDVVPTYRSVAVFFNPLQANLDALMAALKDAARHHDVAGPGRNVEIPVAYGGDNGPDLGDVARLVGLPEAEVVRRHAAGEYRVYMLGFVPGFAYMGIVDESIAVPRRATPRVRVPSGSVGIASRQTGIYPQETPGGWQLIGRTLERPFDAMRTPAFLFGPGDVVRFVSAPTLEDTSPAAAPVDRRDRHEPGGSITVVRPGLLTTVQDLGRWGYQDRGVPVAGPMDAVAHRFANAIVGNAADAATLEATLLGPELRFEHDAVIAVTGADLSLSIDGAEVTLNTAVRVRAGATLRFAQRRSGARAYVAFAGGLAAPPVLGSRATHVLSAMGGFHGRPLAGGDRLHLGQHEGRPIPRRSPAPRRAPSGGVRLRALPGPQDDFFDTAAFDALQQSHFSISPQSNRMAYRLTGGSVRRASDREMISDATVFGGIQVPPSGEPILLMADRQTSGGYPQIATVITADLPLAGQLAPGDWVEFSLCTRREAIAALLAQEGQLLAFG